MAKSKRQLEYEASAAALAHIKITPGTYHLKDNPGLIFSVVEVNEESKEALIQTVHSGFTRTRTFHWCRKNLVQE
jgi:hypothetical protein